ncbi:class I SAM-dependent methyltransferase [Roseibaca sp. V10]|uniref:Class I SAM-dependent methyltransferase n=1 Tax=Roseinatronobacter domitianus TaxID=2940293 RepID=A0ABT0M042_9RHOB|nr:class I SAM-dependent methyltransferase [Roseibaca domitiana]MCL1628226.1 class I SAM-dependent methyltransferase [Roseibaca domitiana]
MGFAPDWLSLRAPADRAARDARLLAMAGARAGERIVDLGAGTGATVRAMSDVVPTGMRWTLVDNDPGLLALAPRLGGRVTGVQADLTELDALPLDGATLVTASALLDLVSEAWLEGLVARLVRAGLPFYAALSYDGEMSWTPEHDEDAAVTRAFNADQRSDKGFGPALGAESATRAATLFRNAGYTVELADSPWRLGPTDQTLQAELLDGIATAAARAGHNGTELWLATRRAALDHAEVRIGHKDLLAVPPERRAHG